MPKNLTSEDRQWVSKMVEAVTAEAFAQLAEELHKKGFLNLDQYIQAEHMVTDDEFVVVADQLEDVANKFLQASGPKTDPKAERVFEQYTKIVLRNAAQFANTGEGMDQDLEDRLWGQLIDLVTEPVAEEMFENWAVNLPGWEQSLVNDYVL